MTSTLKNWLVHAGLAGKQLALAVRLCDDNAIDGVADLEALARTDDFATVFRGVLIRGKIAKALASDKSTTVTETGAHGQGSVTQPIPANSQPMAQAQPLTEVQSRAETHEWPGLLPLLQESELAPLLEESGLLPMLQQTNTVNKLTALLADPVPLLERVSKACMPVIARLLQHCHTLLVDGPGTQGGTLAPLVERVEPYLQRVGLSWQADARPLLAAAVGSVASIEKLQAAIDAPGQTVAGAAEAMGPILAKLAQAMTSETGAGGNAGGSGGGGTDAMNSHHQPTPTPEANFADTAKLLIIRACRPTVEPYLKEQGLEWEDLQPLLESLGWADLRKLRGMARLFVRKAGAQARAQSQSQAAASAA